MTPAPQALVVQPGIRAVLVGDDGWWLLRADGTTEPVLAGGHPRPGAAHATATRRPS